MNNDIAMTNQTKNKKNTTKVFNIIGKIFLYAVLVLFAVTIIVPIGWAILCSLKPKSDFTNNSPWALPSALNFNNYVNAWVGAEMGSYFVNTIIITVIALALLLVLSVPAAYVLTRYKFFGRKFLLTFMMAGIFINVNYIVVPLFSMFSNVERTLNIANLSNNIFTVALINAATSLPFSIYLMTGFFSSLSPAFEEAARIDGCGYFKMLIKIIVPLAMPSILIVILFNFLKFWNEYLISATFLIDKSSWTVSIGLLDIMEVERLAGDRGRMFAGLCIVMFPTIIFYALVQNQLTKGVTVGGVKG